MRQAYDPARPRRRSIRLPLYDYAAPGWYFVTLCAQHRACLFGEVAGETVRLSTAGRIVQAAWDDLPSHYPRVVLDAFVVMPNHLHGIVGITEGEADPDSATRPDGVGAIHELPLLARDKTPRHIQRRRMLLPMVVGRLKTTTAKEINRLCGTPGEKVWQRNYWERVLRDERELTLARDYIVTNPLRWHLDRLHPNQRPW